MKFHYVLFIVFGLGIASIIGMLTDSTYHENIIVGEWQETKWIYDGKEDLGDLQLREQTLQGINFRVGHDFFLHEDENWVFHEDGTLSTSTKEHSNDQNLRWVVKGRGNILVLKDGDKPIESYNITKLDKDTMVLYFAVDLQAKGVAELVFTRIR